MLSLDNLPTRERSLQAAIEVVRELGFDELTTRAIARKSGLTQPAIYRHFSGKEELVREVLGAIREDFYEKLARVDGADPLDGLVSALGVFRDYAVSEPRLYEALFFQYGEDAIQPPPVNPDRGGNIFGFLVDRVSECTKAGVVRSDGPVGSALTLAAHAQGLILLFRQGRFGSDDRFAKFYERSMRDLIGGLAQRG